MKSTQSSTENAITEARHLAVKFLEDLTQDFAIMLDHPSDAVKLAVFPYLVELSRTRTKCHDEFVERMLPHVEPAGHA